MNSTSEKSRFKRALAQKWQPTVHETLQQRTVADVVREMIDESLRRWAENVAYDPVDVIEKLERLEKKVTKAAEAGAEVRYFARLSAMYGMDVAHYVSQKTEIGVVPKPPDKAERDRLLAMYEGKCSEFRSNYLGL